MEALYLKQKDRGSPALIKKCNNIKKLSMSYRTSLYNISKCLREGVDLKQAALLAGLSERSFVKWGRFHKLFPAKDAPELQGHTLRVWVNILKGRISRFELPDFNPTPLLFDPLSEPLPLVKHIEDEKRETKYQNEVSASRPPWLKLPPLVETSYVPSGSQTPPVHSNIYTPVHVIKPVKHELQRSYSSKLEDWGYTK